MQTETTEVLMPLMGEGITEATLVKWLKQPGDALRKDEPLLEVSTDKVDTEIPSPAAGTLLKVFAKDGDVVAVNEIVALIGNPDGLGAFTAPAQTKTSAGTAIEAGARGAQAPNGAASTHAAAAFPGRRSSPLVRKMAKEHRIDLEQVAGSGLHGRITKRDIEAHREGERGNVGGAMGETPRGTMGETPRGTMAGTMGASEAVRLRQGFGGSPAQAPVTGLGQGVTSEQLVKLKTRVEGGIESLEGVRVRREKMSRMRSLIAEHMVRSVRTSPHVTTVFEIDMHRVVKMREKNKGAFAVREGFNLTFTPFFVYAAVQAIKRFPAVNCSVDGDDILWKDQINIGVAVAIDSGLIVPVIRDAGELSVLGIARRLNDLAGRARSKKLLPEDVQGGTFSITNPGMFGSIVSTPIINQPQVAILSIGAIVKRPVVIDDLIGIRPLVQIGLTFDHRVVDGEGGARYLAFLKKTLEEFPESEL